MPAYITLRCSSSLSKNAPHTLIEIAEGTTLLQAASQLELAERPVAAVVNNRVEPLSYRVYGPKDVVFVSASTTFGAKVLSRSLSMLLYKAVTECFPGTRLRIEHSIGGGHYCRLFKGQTVTPAATARLEQTMRSLAAAAIPFERHEALTVEVAQIFRERGLNDKVRLLTTCTDLYTVYYTLAGTPDAYYGPLAPDTSYCSVFALVPYKEGFLLMGPDPACPTVPAEAKPQEKLYDAFKASLRLNQALRVRNAGELNLAVARGDSAYLINVAEAMHARFINAIAERINNRFGEGRRGIVMIAGPSSSGKTTFTKRLAVQLATFMRRAHTISLDNYFVDRDTTPRDPETGDFDFESLRALNLELFNDHLNRLLAGEEVELPYYNFEKGRGEWRGERLRLGHDDLLLIEGIHGLNPELTAAVDEDSLFRVFVSALTSIAIDDHNWLSTTDNRLLRRMVRDFKYRGVSATETIRRWPDVRRGEEKWIFPYQENADEVFNSSLMFELSVIKETADGLLRGVPRNCPEHAEASRLIRLLSYFAAIGPNAIPPTSLLREFLGGSSFHY